MQQTFKNISEIEPLNSFQRILKFILLFVLFNLNSGKLISAFLIVSKINLMFNYDKFHKIMSHTHHEETICHGVAKLQFLTSLIDGLYKTAVGIYQRIQIFGFIEFDLKLFLVHFIDVSEYVMLNFTEYVQQLKPQQVHLPNQNLHNLDFISWQF